MGEGGGACWRAVAKRTQGPGARGQWWPVLQGTLLLEAQKMLFPPVKPDS